MHLGSLIRSIKPLKMPLLLLNSLKQLLTHLGYLRVQRVLGQWLLPHSHPLGVLLVSLYLDHLLCLSHYPLKRPSLISIQQHLVGLFEDGEGVSGSLVLVFIRMD